MAKQQIEFMTIDLSREMDAQWLLLRMKTSKEGISPYSEETDSKEHSMMYFYINSETHYKILTLNIEF